MRFTIAGRFMFQESLGKADRGASADKAQSTDLVIKAGFKGTSTETCSNFFLQTAELSLI